VVFIYQGKERNGNTEGVLGSRCGGSSVEVTS
jgi:hypothetical protein